MSGGVKSGEVAPYIDIDFVFVADARCINPESLDTITDPAIVKFVDDFRRLKESTSKGAAKRKVTPTKKALPTKKPKSLKKKAQDKANTVRAKAFAKDSTKADQDAFLRQLASNSLKL